MSNQSQGGKGNTQHDASTTVALGHRTRGEAGSSPTHETMAETGGSGGPGLTRNEGLSKQDEEARSRQSADDRAMNATVQPDSKAPSGSPDDADRSDTKDSGARGFQDTRSEQAGGSDTGLGTPETGANQDAADLEHHRKDRGA
ncbi:MAG: hypothetical protein ACXWC4_02065 [Telluria sp.]